MTNLYIDESGSMTCLNLKHNPFFVICIVKINDYRKAKSKFKRFISSHLEELKNIDENGNKDKRHKMFKGDKFHELKGSSLTKSLKHELAEYLCQDNILEVYYIKLDNKIITPSLFKNKARAFNYLIGLCLKYNFSNGNLPIGDEYDLQIDERNVKVQSVNALEDYLNIELALKVSLIDSLNVKYYDSACNSMIQISDFFSNLFYSNLMNNKYKELLNQLENDSYIKHYFKFPLSMFVDSK